MRLSRQRVPDAGHEGKGAAATCMLNTAQDASRYAYMAVQRCLSQFPAPAADPHTSHQEPPILPPSLPSSVAPSSSSSSEEFVCSCGCGRARCAPEEALRRASGREAWPLPGGARPACTARGCGSCGGGDGGGGNIHSSWGSPAGAVAATSAAAAGALALVAREGREDALEARESACCCCAGEGDGPALVRLPERWLARVTRLGPASSRRAWGALALEPLLLLLCLLEGSASGSCAAHAQGLAAMSAFICSERGAD